MNCFQIIIFVSPETTMFWYFSKETPLWIAFKLLFLCRQKQPITADFSLFGVVNCFQIIIFVSPETTCCRVKKRQDSCELLSNYYFCVARNNRQGKAFDNDLLWIAFKLLFLCRQKQQFLLSIVQIPVVNCFQIIIFVSPETTKNDCRSSVM